MLRKIVFVLCINFLFSCSGKLSENTNKYMVFFNYAENEICLFDMDTGNIEKKLKIDFDLQEYHEKGYTYRSSFKYFGDNENVYLLRGYSDWDNESNSYTKIFKINFESFEITEFYYAEEYFHEYFVTGNFLYKMNCINLFDDKIKRDKSYIIKCNIFSGTEELIEFNNYLSEDGQINIYDNNFNYNLFVVDNIMILNGWNDMFQMSKLYRYDMTREIINLIDEDVIYFSILNNKILYKKNYIERNHNSVIYTDQRYIIYDLNEETKMILPDKFISDCLLVDKNKIIFSTVHLTIKRIFEEAFLSHSHADEDFLDYYISDLEGTVKRRLFSSRDPIVIIGVMDKR